MAVDLAGLGKVGGIGGIAVGAAVLILQPLIENALPGLDPEARAQAVQVIALGGFVLGALGIMAWVVSARAGRAGQWVKAGHHGVAAGRDAVVGSKVGGSREDGGADERGERTAPGHQQVRAGRHGIAAGRDAVVNSEIDRKGENVPSAGGKRRP